MKVLIAYYSRTGTTKRVAQSLAARLGGTLCPITESRSRLGLLGYQRSLFEAVFGRDAAIAPTRVDPAQFDLVLIGTPVWGWHLSSPARAFARRHAGSVRRCAFFCTMGSAGAARAFAELQRLLHRTARATLALTDSEVGSRAAASKIDAFVAALKSGGTVRPPAGALRPQGGRS